MSSDEIEGLSDTQLVDWYRRTHETPYFAELFHRHKACVYSIRLAMLRNPADAEDYTQETFAKAFRGIDSFRGSDECDIFAHWLKGIAKRACLTRLQAIGRHGRVVLQESDSGALERIPDPTDATDGMDREEVISVLQTLSPDQRQALKLAFVAGCSHKEIARVIGVERSKVRSLIQNGKRMFRNEWERRKGAGPQTGEKRLE